MAITVVLLLVKYKDPFTSDITPIRFTNAPFDVWYDEELWVAAGDLLSIGEQETNYEIVTEGVVINLSGLNPTLQPLIDQYGFRKAPVDIMLGTLPDGTDEIESAAYWHRGFALSPVTELDSDSNTVTVIFETEPAFRDLSKTATLMTTSMSHHQALHPQDRFFEYTADSGLGEETWK